MGGRVSWVWVLAVNGVGAVLFLVHAMFREKVRVALRDWLNK